MQASCASLSVPMLFRKHLMLHASNSSKRLHSRRRTLLLQQFQMCSETALNTHVFFPSFVIGAMTNEVFQNISTSK